MKDLSMHVMDIIQNSIAAGATEVVLDVKIESDYDRMMIRIEDNGRGMSPEQVEQLSNPFFTTRTTRRVGMGVPLFRHSAEQSGGKLTVKSELGVGTVITATFEYGHIDRPPIGELANSFVLTVSANPEVEFVLNYSVNKENYRFDTREVKEILDGIPLSSPQVIKLLTELIDNNISIFD